MKKQVFLSYAREDQAIVEVLRERVLAWGYEPYVDKYDLAIGAYWTDEIDAALRASDVVVGIMSPAAIGSRNVKNEWDWALVNNKRLILMMFEQCDDVPMNYVSIHRIIATAPDDASGLHELKEALRSPAARPRQTADPYEAYLQELYDRINSFLAKRIMPSLSDGANKYEPIKLKSKRVKGAVDASSGKGDEYDPLLMDSVGGDIEGKSRVYDTFNDAFVYYDGRMLLLGAPGAGKTTTLFQVARDAILLRKQDPTQPLPILNLIREWHPKKYASLSDWLEDSYGSPANVKQLLAEGRALLILDGLDEVGEKYKDEATKKDCDPRLLFMEQIPANNRVLISCRAKDYQQIGAKIRLRGAVALQPLDDAQLRIYLRRLPKLLSVLTVDRELREVLKTPLLLTLFAEAYQEMDAKELQHLRNLKSSPGELRDRMFSMVITRRYDQEKSRRNADVRFTLDEIYEVFGRALVKKESKSESVWASDFDDVLDTEYAAEFVELASRLHILAPNDSGYSYRFIHLLLKDHFAFRFALRQLRNKRFYPKNYSYDSSNPADVLGQLGDSRAVPALISALQDENLLVRKFSAQALGEIRDLAALDPLLKALKDKDDWVRSGVGYALGKLGTRALQPLLKALHDECQTVRAGAAQALGKLGNSQAVEPLIAALNDSDLECRRKAAVALGELKDSRAVEPLISALRNGDVSREAARSLGQLRDSRGVEPLIDVLSGSDSYARSEAADALRSIGDGRALEPFTLALHDKDESVRISAVEGLSGLGAVSSLILALNNADAETRARAATRLGNMKASEALEPLRNSLNDKKKSVREMAVRALAEIKAVGLLSEALHHTYPDVRLHAAQNLGLLKDRSAVRPLIEALRDKRPKVRWHAAKSLGELRDPLAIGPLSELLKDSSEAGDVYPRSVWECAKESLKRIGTPEALAAVDAFQPPVPRSLFRFFPSDDLFMSMLRVFVGISLLQMGLSQFQTFEATTEWYRAHAILAWLPPTSAAYISTAAALTLAICLILGLQGRFIGWMILILFIIGILPYSRIFETTTLGYSVPFWLLLYIGQETKEGPEKFSLDYVTSGWRWQHWLPTKQQKETIRSALLLLFRLCVAGYFLLSALSGIQHLDVSILAREHKRIFLSPAITVYAGIASELFLSILLAFGLGGGLTAFVFFLLLWIGVIRFPPFANMTYSQGRMIIMLFVLSYGAGQYSIKWKSLRRSLKTRPKIR